jgi:hypothetical protein
MGMLFDHGVDAFVAVLTTWPLMRMLSFTPMWSMIFINMIAIFPFYFVTMEQYYTGEMNFPPINGVDEGSVVILICCIVSGFYGNVALWE